MDCTLKFDFDMPTSEGSEDTTVAAVCESIETNLWLADAYASRGAEGLAIECLRTAWLEYVRFRDVLSVYSGEELGDRLVRVLISKAGEGAAKLAFGPDSEAGRLWQVRSAA